MFDTRSRIVVVVLFGPGGVLLLLKGDEITCLRCRG